MCRVRFGLTGVYFDSLEPSRPREEVFQPLIAAIPPVAQNKQGDVVPEAIDGGAIKEKVVTATGTPKNDEDGTTKTPRDSSLSSSRDEEGCRLAKKAKTNHASVGSKRVRDSSLSSSPSSVSLSSSSSSASSPPSSDEDQVHKSANSKISVQASKRPKPVNSRTTQKCNDKSFKTHTSIPPGGLTKAPASDDASDTSSSHSSDDSYTDPPSPTEPYDAFAGYYRTPGASRSHHIDGRTAGSRMRFPAAAEINTDGADGFLDSEDGSEVDVQGLPVKERPPRTVRAVGKSQIRDQRHHLNISTPPARSKHSGRVMDQSRIMAGGLESNVDSGLHLEQSQEGQKKPVSPLQSGGQLRYPKLRSGKNLLEPIFVVRPNFLSDTKKKGMPADMLSSSGYSRGISKNGHEGAKTPPPRPTRVKAPKKNKTTKYRAPSVSDDCKRDAEFDEDLGLRIRDV